MRRFRVDGLFFRPAASELWRGCSPTEVRVHWAFRDFIGANVMMDHADRHRAEPPAGTGGGRG